VGKANTVADLSATFAELIQVLLKLVTELLALGLHWSLLIAYVAWWLFGVNWSKAWPVLARGAWVPLTVFLVATAIVWSQMAPSDCTCLRVVTIKNFWWQLGDVGLLAAIALFCGWLQGVMHWAPAEISLEPPAATGHAGHAGHH
jgi:hypothetical protein